MSLPSNQRDQKAKRGQNSDIQIELDHHSELKLSASKRAKTEKYDRRVVGVTTHRNSSEGSDGILTRLFESPLGMIRRMWSGVFVGS